MYRMDALRVLMVGAAEQAAEAVGAGAHQVARATGEEAPVPLCKIIATIVAFTLALTAGTVLGKKAANKKLMANEENDLRSRYIDVVKRFSFDDYNFPTAAPEVDDRDDYGVNRQVDYPVPVTEQEALESVAGTEAAAESQEGPVTTTARTESRTPLAGAPTPAANPNRQMPQPNSSPTSLSPNAPTAPLTSFDSPSNNRAVPVETPSMGLPIPTSSPASLFNADGPVDLAAAGEPAPAPTDHKALAPNDDSATVVDPADNLAPIKDQAPPDDPAPALALNQSCFDSAGYQYTMSYKYDANTNEYIYSYTIDDDNRNLKNALSHWNVHFGMYHSCQEC